MCKTCNCSFAAAAKDADRFYKITKDFADRTERAIARLQSTRKKKI